MLIEHRGQRPQIHPTAYVAPTAVLVGDVSVGSEARIMYGAIVDAEGSRVEIGPTTIICENAVLRATAAGDTDHPVTLADHVFVGPHATLLGCAVEAAAYVATGATILQGAVVQPGAAIAVGALVHARTVVPAEFFVPPNCIATGDPIRLLSPSERDELARAISAVGFAQAAFGITADWDDRLARYRRAAEVRSKEFGEHRSDLILPDSPPSSQHRPE